MFRELSVCIDPAFGRTESGSRAFGDNLFTAVFTRLGNLDWYTSGESLPVSSKAEMILLTEDMPYHLATFPYFHGAVSSSHTLADPYFGGPYLLPPRETICLNVGGLSLDFQQLRYISKSWCIWMGPPKWLASLSRITEYD